MSAVFWVWMESLILLKSICPVKTRDIERENVQYVGFPAYIFLCVCEINCAFVNSISPILLLWNIAQPTCIDEMYRLFQVILHLWMERRRYVLRFCKIWGLQGVLLWRTFDIRSLERSNISPSWGSPRLMRPTGGHLLLIFRSAHCLMYLDHH